MIQAKLAAHGMVCFAHHQTKGKGQRGKIWATEPNSNITLSVILNTSFLQLHQQFYFNAAMALAVLDFFKNYAGDATSIKWPNDIYWNDRKAGGILIETKVGYHTQAETKNISTTNKSLAVWNWAIVGIGININQTQFNAAVKNAVSLKQITGKEFNVISLAKELCTYIEKRFEQVQKENFTQLLESYNKHLFKRNEEVKLKKKNMAFTCSIKGVNERGELLVDGYAQDSFLWGEVEWQL